MVRWSGQVQPFTSESYTFYTTTDEGVRLWVDHLLLIDRWIEYKREREIQPLRLRPHPLEFAMYYDV